MARNADLTRRRLLDAATAEFAERGIAGARVDRIAVASGVNKAMIYRYFGNKDGLFDAAFKDLVSDTIEAVPIDATDLAGYAGQLFDHHHSRSDVVRLATWRQLEAADRPVPGIVATADKGKIAAISKAQRDGVLPRHFTARELLTLIVHLSLLGAPTYVGSASAETRSLRRRRHVVVEAVRRLLAD